MNYTEIEKLYSPSMWTNRDNVGEKHVKFGTEETEDNRKNIPCTLNIPYGDKERQKYDLYGSDLPDDAPIFIYIHGGYWQELSKENAAYVVKPFYKNKIKTFVIGYSICPDVTVRDIVEEISTAVKRCIDYAEEHKSRGIVISGFSAGSHLIASLFSTLFPTLTKDEQSLMKAIILCCGIYDLTPLITTYINKPLNLTHEEAKFLSPMFQNFEKLNLRVHIVVGTLDSPAFQKQSKEYYEKIKSLTDASFKIIKDVDHVGIVEEYCKEDYELVDFILKLI